MTVWLIEPRDTILVRDGRPFSNAPGVKAATLPFPVPSTTTGVTRTRMGLDAKGLFDTSRVDEVLEQTVRGPFLARLNDSGDVSEWLFPAPSDAVVFEGDTDGEAVLRQVVPLRVPDGCQTDLDSSLTLVGLATPDPRKPVTGAPAFWGEKRMMAWLSSPSNGEKVKLDDLGIAGPVKETRTHVSVDPGNDGGGSTGTAREGALFQTGGLRFQTGHTLSEVQRLALAVDADGSMAGNLKAGVAPFGGERRLVSWRNSKNTLPPLPEAIRDQIVKSGRLRLIVVTPACFTAGFKPDWVLREFGLELEAAAIPRYQTLTGWDLRLSRPKPSRRMVASGAVFFVRFRDDVTPDTRKQALSRLWLQPISDVEQDRRDGFGICLVGTAPDSQAEL